MSIPTNGTSIPTRRVIVDDTDAQIQYVGPWQVDSRGSQDRVGNFGPTFLGTLHGVVHTSATFSFLYEGTDSKVFGTLQAVNQSGTIDPRWTCSIDDRIVPISPITPYPLNNWPLCDFTSIGAGVHNITVRIVSEQKHFWLDYIDYVPSPNPTIPTKPAFNQIDDQDNSIFYDDSWSRIGDFSMYTSRPGGRMTTNFTGTGVSWYGFIPEEMSHPSSLATYSIDDEAPIPFVLHGILASDPESPTLYNQEFFQTPLLPYGNHTLTVVHNGNDEQTPLTLDRLVVLDHTANTVSVQTADIPLNTSSTAAPSGANSQSAPLSSGSIAGAVIGALLLLALLIVGFIFGRRWYRKRSRPIIQPLPGFVPPSEPRAPLDLDTTPNRYSVELEERMQTYGTLTPVHVRRRSRHFNPEVRSTITSMDFDLEPPPPLQHAATTNANTEHARGSMLSQADMSPVPGRSTGLEVYGEVERLGATSRSTDALNGAEMDPYSSGYPFARASPGISPYEQLVAATKAEEARRSQRKSRGRHHQDPGYQ
ncbi:hypothetical protein D9611_014856 [Ephemerocybe angulata]|uniref:Transmembrane protein n=1 Tax=Ephemerocybe angulata TaxID=980116 RepID=A0A8H5B786_9AGAR|nr:hypothetical protein D9611_014856 [Tulosesus angulatus]